jgi:hydroxyacylglutathione hydrolase
MNITPFVHEGLGNSSYLVELGGGEAALIDPDRSAARYLAAAGAKGLRITSIFETHLHADFVSGALEAAHAAGAPVFGARAARYAFAHRALEPGERVRAGGAEVEAIASPGHTPEHLGYVVRAGRRPPALFSGGALIVGGAARTDLIAPELTDELTRAQHRTLRSAFARLPDDTELFPTHGGGSFCSTGAGQERTSTLGRERATNPALDIDDEDEFARWFPTTFPGRPDYFLRMRPLNQRGPRLRADIAPPPALAPDAFERAAGGAWVIDARDAERHAVAHIPGSLSIAFRDVFPVWLGWVVPGDARLLFVVEEGTRDDVIDQSLLVGYEAFDGWLEGGVEAWERSGRPLGRTVLASPAEAHDAAREGALVLDVREPDEYGAGHVPGALHVPLGDLPGRADALPKDRPAVVYCGIGERSATAASLLERAGAGEIISVKGGFRAWKKSGLPVAGDASVSGARASQPH